MQNDLTKDQQELISQLMKTSADEVLENNQTQTNIKLAHDILKNSQNSNFTEKDAILANTYSNLAIADQLVLLNRTIGMYGQFLIQQQSQRIMTASPSIVKGL